MITPEYLREGDRVALVAPAGKIDPAVVETAIQTLKNWGLEIVIGKHLFQDHFQYAASDSQRLEDLQQALDDESIKAILCARGGYGTIRVIDKLNFNTFRHNPKWIIGFSDITVLHSHIQRNLGIETIHGSMAAGLAQNDEASNSLRIALFGESLAYSFPSHELSRNGKSKGTLIGGNLAILTSLLGSDSIIQARKAILFIEETGEHLYRIDRMMWSLRRAGILDKLAGLIVGSMTEIPEGDENFGKSALEIIEDHVKDYKYPVCMNFPAGHQKDNRALILGRTIRLEVSSVTSVFFSSLK